MKVRKFLFTMCLLSSISGAFCYGNENQFGFDMGLVVDVNGNGGDTTILTGKKRKRDPMVENGDLKKDNLFFFTGKDNLFFFTGKDSLFFFTGKDNLFFFTRPGFSSPKKVKKSQLKKKLCFRCCDDFLDYYDDNDRIRMLSSDRILLGCGHTVHLSCLANSEKYFSQYMYKKCPECEEKVDSFLLAMPSDKDFNSLIKINKLIFKIIPDAIKTKTKIING